MDRPIETESPGDRVTLGDETILDDLVLRISHTIDDNSGFKGWYGIFAPEGFIDTDTYHLILNDGREGDVIVTNVNISNRGVHAQFNGSGPLK